MIILFIILSGFLLILLWLLFIPFSLTINTNNNFYRFRLPVLFSLKAIKKEDQWQITGKFLFIRFNPLKKKNVEKKEKKEKKKKIQSLKIPKFLSELIVTFKKILWSLSIKKFRMDIDTGDYTLNAQLYPIVQLLRGNHNDININFENRNYLNLNVSGQLYIIAYHSLIFYIKTKKLFT